MKYYLFKICEFIIRLSAEDWLTWYGYIESILTYLYNL